MALRLLKEGETTRIWGYIYWLEDLEKAGYKYGDLLAFLQDVGMPIVCSPVHDRDRYTSEDVRGWLKRHDEYMDRDTGEIAPEHVDKQPKVGAPKKAHIHVYGRTPGPKKGKDLAEDLSEFIPVNPRRFVKVPDWDYIVRYCAHLDAPEKAPYNPSSVHGFGNADLSALSKVSKTNKYAVLSEINDWMKQSKCRYFHRLNSWAMETGDANIIDAVTGRASYYNAIFQSMRQEKADKEARKKAEG